ncbi:MAG TPA: ABC transporter ATP-binding protein [Eoetvoesiella sp.]|uniref:ABC transporter ATP-binding protein n=1 Tax=Eoetvoesiella sp. TaxID=1966355 RepID=UPI002BCA6D78|nr:ABC transporter ATP-binding protein [Eoetvoesiella sp.]HWK60840.1 ABC transporter ATP-binding protein [Eoetvoesiella sp.]
MTALLSISDLQTSYGTSQVLFGVSFEVSAGQCVTLIGRNGMGKSTTINTIMGWVPPRSGTVHFAGQDITGRAPYQVAKAGIGLVPEGRRIFPTLTVKENLVATATQRSQRGNPWSIDKIYQMFPRLKERERNLGSNLSGGEQQMLAIGRALLTNPTLLILDEATEGLAPVIRAEIWKSLENLKASGLALIVIDKNIGPLLRVGDHHYIVEKGRIVWDGASAELRSRPELLREYVGV